MKAKLPLLVLTVGAMVTFASCKKCEECHYDLNGAEVEVGELCDEELEDAEANGWVVGDTVYTIHCHEH
jgi:hypothetical protein